MYMTPLFLLFIILLMSVSFPFVYSFSTGQGITENFRANNLGNSMGKYPKSEDDVLLQYGDSYPISGKNGVSNHGESDIWWHYPIFKVGSYAQITNNLKYPNNPDNGTCSRSEFCGALYNNRQIESNISKPLPPVEPTCGARINYYSTPENLLTYRNITSILY